MEGFFRFDGPFMSTLSRIANMIIVSFFWCICCIPVVTIVPASAALYHTTVKVIRGKGAGVARDFFTTFKNELKQGIILTIICLISGLLLYTALDFGWQFKENTAGFIYMLVGVVITAVWSSVVYHIPAVLSRFKGSVKTILQLSFYFASGRVPRSLGALVLLAGFVFAVDFYPVLLMLMPGMYVDLTCNGLEKVMEKYISDSGLAEDAAEETEENLPETEELSALALAAQMDESE